jgi:hypothetical protein
MVKDSDKMPGREIPPDYREVATELVRNQGWRYVLGGRHPVLFPPDRTKRSVTIAGSPGDKRGFRNFVAEVRRQGGVWPPVRKP